nr:hypothetical protein [Tanacetum cinerariifolium]
GGTEKKDQTFDNLLVQTYIIIIIGSSPLEVRYHHRKDFRGILQFVLLGLEDRREEPNWILRLANDRDGWGKYPWGSYVWPTLYSQLKDANVKRWPSLYATEPKKDVEHKTYTLVGFTWAFKTWILESFRVGTNDYYKRYRHYPRVVAWSSKRKFYRHMLHGFFHVGRLPIERFTPDETKARSDWWVLSMAYFDGRISEAKQIPRHVNRQNHYEVPSEFYREFEEQKRVVDQMMKKDVEREKMYEQVPTPNWSILSYPHDASLLNPNILNREMREVRPGMYRRTPYMDLPPTTVLPKKRGDKTKNKVKNANVSPLNLRNAFVDDNVGGDMKT